MDPEFDSAALNRALARLIDPDGTRMITGIRFEAHVKQVPTLTVWEYVRPETLKDLEEIVRHYRIVPENEEPASKDWYSTVRNALIDAGIVRLEDTGYQEFPVVADHEAFQEFINGVNALVFVIRANTTEIQPPTTGDE